MPVSESDAFKKLYDVIVRLRGPGGCTWDREQTPSTLRSDLIEETYECIEAIDENNAEHIKEELGDIFLLAGMIAYMHEESGEFTVADTLEGIAEKLIRRHPHVFNVNNDSDPYNLNSPGLSSEEILKNWAKMKVEQEGRRPKDSAMDEVKKGFPPMDRAFQLQKKAAELGFDWQDVNGVIEKINEELSETREALVEARSKADTEKNTRLEDELGDLLFSVINLCRFTGIDPSLALQRTNIKFTERFKYVEKSMKEKGEELKAENLDLMEKFWQEAK